jgi:hypothetical protein
MNLARRAGPEAGAPGISRRVRAHGLQEGGFISCGLSISRFNSSGSQFPFVLIRGIRVKMFGKICLEIGIAHPRLCPLPPGEDFAIGASYFFGGVSG